MIGLKRSSSATITTPSCMIRRRMTMLSPSAGAIMSPSRTRRPALTSAIFPGAPGARRTISPFCCTTASGMPLARPSRACSCMCRISPWTGTSTSGRSQPYRASSSGRPGWPETWIMLCRSVTIVMPLAAKRFCTAPMASSLPGIWRLENSTTSPATSSRG